MPEITFAQLHGWRVIATPSALDAMSTAGEVVRISADDAFVIGGQSPVVDGDPHAIITPEHGFDGAALDSDVVTSVAEEHIEWQVPAQRPALAQGQIAGVPAKLVLRADGTTLLLVASAARHELETRLAP